MATKSPQWEETSTISPSRQEEDPAAAQNVNSEKPSMFVEAAEVAQIPTHSLAPDGGLRAWTVVLAVCGSTRSQVARSFTLNYLS